MLWVLLILQEHVFWQSLDPGTLKSNLLKLLCSTGVDIWVGFSEADVGQKGRDNRPAQDTAGFWWGNRQQTFATDCLTVHHTGTVADLEGQPPVGHRGGEQGATWKQAVQGFSPSLESPSHNESKKWDIQIQENHKKKCGSFCHFIS